MTVDQCLSAAARRASRMLDMAGREQGAVLWQPLVEALEEECAHARSHFLFDNPTPEMNDCARGSLEQIVLTALILYSTSALNKDVPVPDERLDA